MERLRERISQARRAYAAGGEAVLEALQRATHASAQQLDAALRQHAGVAAVVDITDAEIDFTALTRSAARTLECAPIRLRSESDVRIAMIDPWDRGKVRQVSQVLGRAPALAVVPAALLDKWLRSEPGEASPAPDSRAAPAADSPVVDFVDAAMRNACRLSASDVHFECDRSGVTTRLRIDGVMTWHSRLDGVERAEEVVSRIKVLAQLDITERRTPQDGRFRLELGASSGMDLRVSVIPNLYGEDAVLRLLDKAQLRTRPGCISLASLGFADPGATHLHELAELPHGMLMVTGPTGSGKTTTVYALLSEVSSGLEKVITIEDPVEYELPGVLQIPVNERKGLTFAKGLRSILRHDPDRILVGEIRDAETAEIAVQSALTGHQVLTTVHANSIFDVTGRFRHFGLDMFGFMSSLNGVVVQRLVRTLCTHCAGVRTPTERERRWLGSNGTDLAQVPVAVGCEKCRGTGFRGRTVLAEVHAIDDQFRDLVVASAPVSELRSQVANSGAQTLTVLASRAIASGKTTTEEVRRVVGW